MLWTSLLLLGTHLISTTQASENLCVLESPHDLLCKGNFPTSEQLNAKLTNFDQPHIRSLEIRGSSLPDLKPPSFDQLPSLKAVKITDCALQRIHKATFGGQLKNLTLSRNSIAVLEEDALKGSKLVELDLSDNGLEVLPHLTPHPRSLNLSHNHLKTLPFGTFERNHNLRRLILNNNALSVVHDFLQGLNQLELLDLDHNNISDVSPRAYADLGALQILLLKNNSLSTLNSDVFRALDNLKTLDLQQNILEAIRDNTFQHLTSLTHLNLQDNVIEAVHKDAFKHNLKLRVLNLANNYITSLAPGTFAYNSQLEALDLTRNNLERLQYGTFNNLPIRSLKIGFNRLKVLEKAVFVGVGGESGLELDLSHNEIEILSPGAFGSNLRRIELQGNGIKVVPAGVFKRLKLLEGLNLSDNRIGRFERGAFRGIKKIGFLGLSGNNISHIDAGALSEIPVVLFADFRNNEVQEDELREKLRNVQYLLSGPGPSMQ